MDTPITSEDLMQAMFDGIRQPMLAIDSSRRIVLRNRRAALLLQDAALVHQDAEGRFLACTLENDAVLARAFHDMVAGADECTWVRLRAFGQGWTSLLLRRLPTASYVAVAVIVFESPREEEDGSARLAAAFGLTPAEARVAGYVSHGLAPKEVAARCGVSPCTVRSQLRTLFAKTGARRQPELVRLLLLSLTL